MSSTPTRTEAAIQARQQNTEQMLQRVRNALRQMRREHTPIKTAVVARRAEVSRTFLYQNKDAKQLIAEAIARSSDTAAEPVRSAGQAGNPWKDRALNAEFGLKDAYAEIHNQRRQISQLLGRIRDLEHDLPADAIERTMAENTNLRQENRKLTSDNQQFTERLRAARENNRFLDARVADLEARLAPFLLNSDDS